MNLLTGDSRFFYLENIKDFVTFPTAWDSSLNTGLGQPQLSSLWITSYFNFTASFTKLGLDWNLIQLIFWIIPAVLLSFLSSLFLFKYIFKDKKYSIISGIIYSLNTYFLMVLTGGQLGVSLSYSLIPLVLLRFMKTLDNPTTRNFILAGLVLGLQIIFDPRIVYITLVAVLLYFIFNLSKLKILKNKIFLLIPFAICVLLNSFWILPLALTKSSVLPTSFDSVSGFKFFSFADFSHSLSLLHPNWPENIFGKIYFLDPKFLVIPIVAFSSLFFINRTIKQSSNRHLLYFSTLSLLGVFLAKGANPPFGEINSWLFQNLPGMSMFRDPTKWYMLIALGYSILITYAIKEISKYFKFTLILFIIYFLYLSASIFGQIKVHQVPQEYVQLKNFLDSQKTFSRTLWIPKWQRLGYFSNNHPAIGREELLKGNAKKQISELNQSLLMDLSVKYIVVPYDLEGEIFLKDRKYNDKEYQQTIDSLRKLNWLKEVGGFGKIHVFEIESPKDHFWSPSKEISISYSFIKPTEYKVRIQNVKKGDLLVFSEGFDKNWTLKDSKLMIQGLRFEDRLNSFILPLDGNYEVKVYYNTQKYVEAGMFISIASFIVLLTFLKFGKKFKKW